jgi:hypothetical protein
VNTTQQIQRQIADEKTQLKENLTELETRAKGLVDWRARFRKNPRMMLGLAFGGGLLLARMLGGREATGDAADGKSPSAAPRERRTRGLLDQQWKRIEGALVGAASAKATGWLDDLIPGFKDHLRPLDDAVSRDS